MMVVMAATASSRSLQLLVMAVAAALALHRLALQVSALTCHEGVRWRSRVSANSTLKLREGEVLVLHCSTDPQVYQDLMLDHCLEAYSRKEREGNTLNYTWYCHVAGNTSISVYGFPYSSSEQDVNLLEFNVETYDLVQCLADARATPSPCTTPLPDPEHTTTTSNTTDTTEILNITEPDPITATTNGPIDASPEGSRLNCMGSEVREYSLVGVVCVLGVTAIVQFTIIGILCIKLCNGRMGMEVMGMKGDEERGVKMNAIQERGRRVSWRKSSTATETVFTNAVSAELTSSKSCTLF